MDTKLFKAKVAARVVCEGRYVMELGGGMLVGCGTDTMIAPRTEEYGVVCPRDYLQASGRVPLPTHEATKCFMRPNTTRWEHHSSNHNAVFSSFSTPAVKSTKGVGRARRRRYNRELIVGVAALQAPPLTSALFISHVSQRRRYRIYRIIWL